ncbi:MAG: NTP transferase domain-containing protein [Flavipsychrobacter sp.]|nr:NTP transferase domain-containing protein [Flavipsychrobacter sp.]
MTSNAEHKEIPTLSGLVLAGGKSVRMGQDKGNINWHGKEQRYYMADLLEQYLLDVRISCRADQLDDMNVAYKVLPDETKFAGMGPYGGILTAFATKPDNAWLVVACDLPLVDDSTLQYLIANRDTDAIATTFESPMDGHPEPLITIWEPGSLPLLLKFAAEGFKCPRKLLRRHANQVKLLKAPDPYALMNANTPEDLATIQEIVQQRDVRGE